MFQARSEWRHIRLIFDHAEGPLIRFAYSLSWVLRSNYHNCCAKHACLYGRRSGVSVCREEGIPAPNPLNAGWMAGPAGEGDEGEGRDAGPTHSQWQARAAHSTEDTGAPQDRISPPHAVTPPLSHADQLWLLQGRFITDSLTVCFLFFLWLFHCNPIFKCRKCEITQGGRILNS